MAKMMKVEYVGKLEFIAEFNGKRYAFSKKNRIMEMSPSAYAYIVANAGFAADQIVPYDESPELKKKITELEAEIKALKAKKAKKAKKEDKK